MIEPIWIVKEPTTNDNVCSALENVVGVINLANSADGRMVEELLKAGKARLTPFGVGLTDENGVSEFRLIAMTLESLNKVEYE